LKNLANSVIRDLEEEENFKYFLKSLFRFNLSTIFWRFLHIESLAAI